ncbi:MAG: response regulator [Paracoccaceae bacterium]
MLIEDEANIAEAIRFLLERQGWAVSHCTDGTSAIAAVTAFHPDILILDVMLPGRSGYEILDELRNETRFSNLPILILSARGQETERSAALARGANMFMTKPFANAELLDAVRQLARN